MDKYMIQKSLLFFLLLIQFNSFCQTDSTWNVMILKKGAQPEIKDNMAEFSPTGFYLYRNCFYDLKFRDKEKRTLRLIDIKRDTLVFIGISEKLDTDLSITAKDTFLMDYQSIDEILLVKNFSSGAGKKINCDDYYFVFHKSLTNNIYESKYAQIFASQDEKSELVPRLSSHGISYHYEFGGKLYYHSGVKVQTPKYTDDEKIKSLNAVMTILNLIVNKRLDIKIQKR